METGLRLRVPELHPAQGLRPHAPSLSSCALSSLPGAPGWARLSFSLAHAGLVFPARLPGPSGWGRKQDLGKMVLDWNLRGSPELRGVAYSRDPPSSGSRKADSGSPQAARPGIIGINSSFSLVCDPSSFWGGAGRTRKGVLEKCLKQLFLCGSGELAFPPLCPGNMFM